jgi:hypothetical protein
MEIIRNGMKINLTEEELSQAYFEQQARFDIEEVRSELETCVQNAPDATPYSEALRSPETVQDCASEYRTLLNEGRSREFAINEAIQHWVGETEG